MYRIFFVPEGKYVALFGGHPRSMSIFESSSYYESKYDCQNKKILTLPPITFVTYRDCKKIINQSLATNSWLLLYNNPNYFILRVQSSYSGFLIYKTFLPEYFEIVKVPNV